MKKFIAAFLIILVLTLSGCGEASDVGVHLTDSQRYSETELNNVVEAAKSFFAKNFDDCTLYTIDYNDEHNEQVRDDNLWRFRRSFEPKLLPDVLELSVTYYDNQDSDNTKTLITETYYMITLDNGNWEVGDHGRTSAAINS